MLVAIAGKPLEMVEGHSHCVKDVRHYIILKHAYA